MARNRSRLAMRHHLLLLPAAKMPWRFLILCGAAESQHVSVMLGLTAEGKLCLRAYPVLDLVKMRISDVEPQAVSREATAFPA